MADFPVQVGVVGCGNISGIYLQNARRFEEIEVVAVCDLNADRAAAQAAAFGINRVLPSERLFADPDIELILNLTIPAAHAPISVAAVEAGKAVYNEKPLTIRREHGLRLLNLARENGVRVGGAPDTFLGAAWQTARALIDEGAIGEPIAATAFMMCRGHERWHPDPEFYYKVGGGPLFDMGPYYLTALVHLLGPVRRVCGSARISFSERLIGSAPRRGQKIAVETPTHVTGALDFACGAVGTLITTFDTWHANLPWIEVHGAEGSLSLPDPNGFGGTIRLRQADDDDWSDVPLRHPYADNARGVGLADLAHALRTGRPHRASGELAYHVLDVMHALLESSELGRHIEPASTCERPAPLPGDLAPGRLDD